MIGEFTVAIMLIRGGGGGRIGELVALVRGGGGQMIGEFTVATVLIRGGGGGRIGELVALVRGGGGQMIGEFTAATKLIRGGGGGRMGELATELLTTGNAFEFAGFAIAIALESAKAVLKATPQAFNVVETIFGTPLG